MKKTIFLCITLCTLQLFAIPKHVMIIRHGELTAQPEASVTFTPWKLKTIKIQNSQPLSPRGWQRAYALAPFFTMQPNILKYGNIAALFAPNPNSDYNSVRPIQTLNPLSQKLKMKINISYNIDQGAGLVYEIMTNKKYEGKTVLVGYEHMHIPRLAQLFDWYADLGFSIQQETSGITVVQDADYGASLVPTQWGSQQDGTSIFDQVWVLTFDEKSGKIVKFENIAQKLLYQDSANPFNQPAYQTQQSFMPLTINQ